MASVRKSGGTYDFGDEHDSKLSKEEAKKLDEKNKALGIKTNKCEVCGKEASIGKVCNYCDGYYCDKHILPESHEPCEFNKNDEEIKNWEKIVGKKRANQRKKNNKNMPVKVSEEAELYENRPERFKAECNFCGELTPLKCQFCGNYFCYDHIKCRNHNCPNKTYKVVKEDTVVKKDLTSLVLIAILIVLILGLLAILRLSQG